MALRLKRPDPGQMRWHRLDPRQYPSTRMSSCGRFTVENHGDGWRIESCLRHPQAERMIEDHRLREQRFVSLREARAALETLLAIEARDTPDAGTLRLTRSRDGEYRVPGTQIHLVRQFGSGTWGVREDLPPDERLLCPGPATRFYATLREARQVIAAALGYPLR